MVERLFERAVAFLLFEMADGVPDVVEQHLPQPALELQVAVARELIEMGAVDILQTDINLGGITGCERLVRSPASPTFPWRPCV